MIERETNVLNELEVPQGALAQGEEWVVVDVETHVMEELNKFCCSNKKCLDYGKKGVGNIVVHNMYGKSDEIRMLKCKTCCSYFSERRNTALYNCKLQKDTALEIIYHLSKGCSIRKINRLTGVSRDAISRIAHIERQYANSLCNELVRYLKVKKVLFNEK